MSHMNTPFDQDIDSFLNLDNDFTPASASPAVKHSSASIPSQPSVPSSATTFAPSSTPQTFSGPSFQYDAYRQQTGLPIGALANTFAVNQASGMQYRSGNGGFVMPTETLNIPLSKLDDFDFARHPSLDVSDMDFDADSPNDLPTMFYPNSTTSLPGQYISPTTLVSQPGSSSSTATTPVQRIYPGMHSQQAAQAKAQQAQKQQQQEMARRQQQRQSQGQTKAHLPRDPIVEESISRVLSRMRQASVASTAESESAPSTGMSNMPKLKKDEEDMDEDERLLASEEGKKLSSKERRQLRNKVSARAFRSRRKEYIGQLEGEVAAKTQEANDLRSQNQQLREENNRLTDLTRMLLSSQAFSGFLQELSQSGLPPPSTYTETPRQTQVPSQTQPARKDVNPHDAAAQQMNGQQSQVSMALVPETALDMSMLDTPHAWNSTLPANDFQVYAVTELPEAPALDLSQLSGKPRSGVDASSKPSKDAPVLAEMPNVSTLSSDAEPVVIDATVVLDPVAFALYFDDSKRDSFDHVAPQKWSEDMTSVLSPGEIADAGQVSDAGPTLEKMCSELDESCARLAGFIPGSGL